MRTFGDLVCPDVVRRGVLIRDSALVLAGSMLVALCAKIQVPMAPVPITLQTFAVLLVGAALGSRRGALALVAYLLEGAGGLPVFAGPSPGLMSFAGPTAGYLLAFPIAAFVVGYLAERGWDRRFTTAIAAMGVGQVIILALGFGWLAMFVGAKAAYATGVAVFVPGDVLKILLAATALPAAWRLARN
ncbi:MAG: biotin transporter BioY [Phycisphaerae bacterium]|nr:biotin transporter BioY [Phycisphaerae bacterium]